MKKSIELNEELVKEGLRLTNIQTEQELINFIRISQKPQKTKFTRFERTDSILNRLRL